VISQLLTIRKEIAMIFSVASWVFELAIAFAYEEGLMRMATSSNKRSLAIGFSLFAASIAVPGLLVLAAVLLH
jgi:hypothetical protein